MECSCCFGEINNVKIREKDGEWKNSIYCKDCLLFMKETQFNEYVEAITKADCKVSLERLINLGPPTNIRDSQIDIEIDEIKINEQIESGKLENVYPSEELEKYKEFLKSFL